MCIMLKDGCPALRSVVFIGVHFLYNVSLPRTKTSPASVSQVIIRESVVECGKPIHFLICGPLSLIRDKKELKNFFI